MKVEVFHVEHLDLFDNFGGQDYLVSAMPRDQVAAAVARGNHYSVFSGDQIAGCFGFFPIHDWRCTAWALLRAGAPHLFAGLHKHAYRLVRSQPWARIEAYADPDSAAAMRWVALLGFTMETPLKPFFLPDGRAAAEWVFLKRAG